MNRDATIDGVTASVSEGKWCATVTISYANGDVEHYVKDDFASEEEADSSMIAFVEDITKSIADPAYPITRTFNGTKMGTS